MPEENLLGYIMADILRELQDKRPRAPVGYAARDILVVAADQLRCSQEDLLPLPWQISGHLKPPRGCGMPGSEAPDETLLSLSKYDNAFSYRMTRVHHDWPR